MKYNFDEIIDRRNTNSLKYDFAIERNKPSDVLPLWVADMDIKTPFEVREALKKSAEHGIFGYSDVKIEYFNTLHTWFKTKFAWDTKPEWLVKTPGVVFAICTAIRAFTEKGDAVLIQRPVYYPFSLSIKDNERKLVNNPLVYKDGKYEIDFADFEQKIIDNGVKLFILCSPHNPVGRVWSKEELLKIGDICIKHNVLIVADEIHEEFVYEGFKHHVFANLKPEFSDITITCTAPSKTFNLAGLQVSNIFIANAELRHKFKKKIIKTGYCELNAMGLVACQTAYAHGQDWLEKLKVYLAQNLDFTRKFLAEKIPQIKLVEPQGTYLLWLDCSALHLDDKALEDLIINKAKLWLDAGTMFGPEGSGFQRINITCPRATLEKALLKLEAAVKGL
ncbi:MAG: aminotransferase [Firmicutes bacterium]|nr:aminotransferase [Bacillota bacterium]